MRDFACRWFCLWLLLLSISPTVGHAHAGGGAAHCHSATCPVSHDMPDDADVWHWHLLLFGMEVHLPAGTSPAESPPHAPVTPTIDVGADLEQSASVCELAPAEVRNALPSLDTVRADRSSPNRFSSPLACMSITQILRSSILTV